MNEDWFDQTWRAVWERETFMGGSFAAVTSGFNRAGINWKAKPYGQDCEIQ